MKKSQYVFAIMAGTYIVIAFLDFKTLIKVEDNILLGLSMSAFLSAFSDIFSNIAVIRTNQNEFDYIVKVTSDFLGEKILNNQCNPSIDSRNIKLNVETMSKGYKKAVHPNEYRKRNTNATIHILSQICFVFSIAAFILTPFSLFQKSYSVLLTLFAFALMCLNLFLEEIIAGIAQKNNHFFNETQVIIQMAYPDFMGFLNLRLYHYENYISIENKQEDESEVHT